MTKNDIEVIKQYEKLKNQITKEELAMKFSQELVKEIGKFKVCIINKRNSKETNSQICHSHDFCDANEVMLAAKEDLGLSFQSQEEEWDFLSDAWGLAKQNMFYLNEI